MGPLCSWGPRGTTLHVHVLRRHWYNVKPIMTLSIKTILSVLNVLTYVITSIKASPIACAVILALMYAEPFKTDNILYKMFMDNCCTKMYHIYQVLVCRIVRYHIFEIMMKKEWFAYSPSFIRPTLSAMNKWPYKKDGHSRVG